MSERQDQSNAIGAEEARQQLADLLNRAQYRGERFVITRHGKPVAALIPIAQSAA